MESKVLNGILLGFKALAVVAGMFLIFVIMSKGDPKSWDPEQMGIKIYNDQLKGPNGDENFDYMTAGYKAYDESYAELDGWTGYAITLALVLTLVGVFLLLASYFYLLGINLKKAMYVLAGVGTLVIIAGIGWALASDQLHVSWPTTEVFTAENSKFAGAGILTAIILLVVASVSVLAGSVVKLFR